MPIRIPANHRPALTRPAAASGGRQKAAGPQMAFPSMPWRSRSSYTPRRRLVRFSFPCSAALLVRPRFGRPRPPGARLRRPGGPCKAGYRFRSSRQIARAIAKATIERLGGLCGGRRRTSALLIRALPAPAIASATDEACLYLLRRIGSATLGMNAIRHSVASGYPPPAAEHVACALLLSALAPFIIVLASNRALPVVPLSPLICA